MGNLTPYSASCPLKCHSHINKPEDESIVKVYATFKLFHDGGRYHIENSPLICRAYQWTGFYMIRPPS